MRRNSWHAANNCVWRFVSDFVILSKARYQSLGIMYKGKKKSGRVQTSKVTAGLIKQSVFCSPHSCSQCASILKYVKRKTIRCAKIIQLQVTVASWWTASVHLSALTSDPYISLDESCILIKSETNTK